MTCFYSSDFYDNENIEFVLYPLSEDPAYGLSKKDVEIPVGSYRTFRVHVKYKNGVVDNKVLNSIVSFQFLHWHDIFVEDVIPDSEEDEDKGLHHLSLLEAIVGAPNGLNGGSGSTLNKAIDQRLDANANTIGGAQHMTGSTLKKVLQSAGNINLNYLIVFTSETEYDIYTWDISSAKNVGSTITVYNAKAILIDGTWVLAGGEEGTAEVVNYAKFYNGKVSGGESTSIDYNSYVPKPIEDN